MKNILLVIVIILWLSYFFIPYDKQVQLFDKIWIDSSFLSNPKEIEQLEKLKEKIVNLKFNITKKTQFKWNIINWEIMQNLSWASWWFVKCFYEKDYNHFNWNIVLHRVLLWKDKTIKVKLIPEDKYSKISMYIYKTDPLSKIFPPEKTYVHDCKKDIVYKWTREIEMRWNTKTSDIVIWITWSEWLLEWWYTLELEEK